MNYTSIKQLAEAQKLVADNYGRNAREEPDGLFLSGDRHTATWHPDGLVTINASPWLYTTYATKGVSVWPNGVGWLAYTNQRKEYISIIGHDGVTRYYLLPPMSEICKTDVGSPYTARVAGQLLLQPHPRLNYVPVDPIQDYRITISRKQKNAAMAKWKPLFDYVDTIWDLLPSRQNDLEASAVTDILQRNNNLLTMQNKEVWYARAQVCKWSSYSQGKANLRNLLEKQLILSAMWYNIEPVPNTTHDHTAHWSFDLVEKLRKAGRI